MAEGTDRTRAAREPTTHGVSIDIQALHLPHPAQARVEIQFNTWDFGGQEVYRATRQARLGLTRVPTYTGDYRWLCRTHYEQSQPKIPDKIE